MNNAMIQVVNGKPCVTSLQVADSFGKEHFHVLRDIEQVLSQVSENFRKSNFGCSEYTVPNPLTGGELQKPMYILSKDGFTILTMGYSGEKAMKFKEAYIEEFNRMEEELRKSEKAALPKSFPEALRALADSEEEKERIIAENIRIKSDNCTVSWNPNGNPVDQNDAKAVGQNIFDFLSFGAVRGRMIH